MTFEQIIHAFNNWCYNSPMLYVLRDTKLGIPAVQTFHLVGLTMVLGSLVVMNLRLLNLGYRQLPAETFLPQVWRWFRRGLWLTMTAGFIVFLPDPVRYAQNISFRVKLTTLAVALLFTFTVFRKQIGPDVPAGKPQTRTIAVCAITLMLWFAIGWCGRAIAFAG